MVDLNVAITNTGVDTTIEKLQKLLASNKNTATTFVRLAAESKAAAQTVASMATDAAAAGARLQNFDKVLTETGANARSLAAANEILGKSYSDIALRNIGATPRERLTAAGSGDLDKGIAAARAIRAQEEAQAASSTKDLNAVERENIQIEREQERVRREAAAAARDAARAARELAEAQSGRSGAQLGLSRAREDYANQARGINDVESATIRLARAEEDLAAAQRSVAASEAQNRNKGRFAAQDAQYVRNQTAALEGEQAALRGVISAQEQLTRATENQATAAQRSSVSTGNVFASSFSYFIVAGAAQKVADAIAGIGTASISASSELQRAFADVDRTFEGSQSQLSALESRLVELSTIDPISTVQLAEIATLGNQLGVATTDIESFTQTIAQYSTISGQSADASATAFGKISNLTGLTASQYSNLGSAIEYVARTSVSTEAGIQRTAEEITAIAAGAGFSADAIVGLSGTLASLSIPPERARGALSLYFGALNNAVAEGGPKLDAFAQLTGLTTQKIAELVNQNKGQEVFTDFVKGLSDLNNVAKTTALDELGLSTIRVDQTMRALSQNVPLLTDSLAGSSAAFQQNTELARQYGIIQETLASRWTEFQNAVQNGAAAIGDVFNTAGIGNFLGLLTQLIAGFHDFAETPVGKVIVGIGLAMAAVTFVVATLIGGLALLAASMKLVPWALSGLGAQEASTGLVQFIAGLLGVNLSLVETDGQLQVTTASMFGQSKASLAVSAALLEEAGVSEALAAANAELSASSVGTAASLFGIEATAGAAEVGLVGVGAGADVAAAGFNTMKIALISTGIGAAVVLVGSLIAAFAQFGQTSVITASDVGGLADAIAKDTATYRSTGEAITTYGVKLPGVTDDQKRAAAASKAWARILGTELAPAAEKAQSAVTKVAAGDEVSKSFIKALGSNSTFKDIAGNSDFAAQWQKFGFDINDLIATGIKSGGNESTVRAALLEQLGPLKEVDIANVGPGGTTTETTYYDKAGNDVTAFRAKLFALAPVVSSTGKTFQDTANQGIVLGNAVNGVAGAAGGVEPAFIGATSATGAFAAAVQAGIGKFGDFQKIIKDLQDQAKQMKDPSIVDVGHFAQSLKETNDLAVHFYSDVQKAAKQGSTAFATQIAAVGPDGAAILAESLKLSTRAKQRLEENARFAAFLASDAFKNAVKADMEDDNNAYSRIFEFKGKGGGLEGVRAFMKRQIEAGKDTAEKEWDAKHPDLPLNIHFKDPSQDELALFEARLKGKVTVKANVVPNPVPLKPTKVNTYTDASNGKSITLPANLDNKTLSASLAYWLSHENAKPEDIQAKLNTKSFGGDVSAWVAAHGPIKIYANLVPTASSVNKLNNLFNIDSPKNARGGLLDAYGQGHMPGFAKGGGWGQFSGAGTGTSDSLLARVSRGEYISTASATNFWGPDFMDSLNRRMLPTSFANMLQAAAVSGNSGPSHVAHVQVVQNNPLTRDPLHQLREDSEMIAAGIWG